jgi:hypothetical protein
LLGKIHNTLPIVKVDKNHGISTPNREQRLKYPMPLSFKVRYIEIWHSNPVNGQVCFVQFSTSMQNERPNGMVYPTYQPASNGP